MFGVLKGLDLTPAQRSTIERLKSDGRVIVFIYARGLGAIADDGQVLRFQADAAETKVLHVVGPADEWPATANPQRPT